MLGAIYNPHRNLKNTDNRHTLKFVQLTTLNFSITQYQHSKLVILTLATITSNGKFTRTINFIVKHILPVCETVYLYTYIHPSTSELFFVCLFCTSLPSPFFFCGISLSSFKIQTLRNVHGLQSREAGGPLKSSPPVRAGSHRKGP